MDEYSILKKKRKKNGFASTALLISIAIALIAMVGTVLVLSKVDAQKTQATDENSTVEEVTSNKDATCEGLTKELVFNDNIKNIKEAAISYFTDERLPQTVGNKVTITLKDMQSNKLVRNVLDASGKSCSNTNSYVEVTKENNEYIMKIFLSCSDIEDYIIVHLGCYDYCDSDVCEKKEEVVKEYEYEYKKVIACTMSGWSEWGEWKTTREKTSNLKKEDVKVERVTKDYVETKNAKKTATTYNCNGYSGYTLVGDKCVKETKVQDIKDATPSNYSYSCDNYSGYSIVGDKCVKEEVRIESIDALETESILYCPNGYRINGKKCEKNVTKLESKDATLTCASGYTLKSGKCYKTTTSTDTESVTLICPIGYTLNSGKCYKTITTFDSKVATATCPTDYTLDSGKCYKVITSTNSIDATPTYATQTKKVNSSCKKEKCTTKSVFTCPAGKACGTYPQTSCEIVSEPCTKNVTETYISGYTCPYGYSLSGTKCNITSTSTDTQNPTYVCLSGYSLLGSICYKNGTSTDVQNPSYACSSGYTLSGTTCSKTTTSTNTKNPNYTCASGYTLKGTKCEKSVIVKEEINASKTAPELYCNDGYKLNKNKCERKVIVKDTKDAIKKQGGYTCPSGYSLSDKKCYKTITTTDTKDAITNSGVYYCESGYQLNGTKCTKTVTKNTDITYYRYATRKCTGGSTNYEWSKSNNDTSLLNAGYTLTGKKREITTK